MWKRFKENLAPIMFLSLFVFVGLLVGPICFLDEDLDLQMALCTILISILFITVPIYCIVQTLRGKYNMKHTGGNTWRIEKNDLTICPNCGAKLIAPYKFCGECGYKIND